MANKLECSPETKTRIGCMCDSHMDSFMLRHVMQYVAFEKIKGEENVEVKAGWMKFLSRMEERLEESERKNGIPHTGNSFAGLVYSANS